MKAIKHTLILIIILLSIKSFSQGITESTWQDGDIIFIKNPKMPPANEPGDKKNFNCTGLIIHDKEHAYVYFMDDVFKKMIIWDFIDLSEGKKYSVKWLAEKDLVDQSAVNTMQTYCNAKIGDKKDNTESLNSEELFNAEFVWKIYMSTLGVKLCEPKDLNISADSKKDLSTTGYTNKTVTVRDIYRSELLE
ncbi:MAG: hypothetical protein IPM51_03035 [Sphingobacteriaceae bacterium]|nr:hypothetical protein [Sphingobacteriaceae bacterium]